MNDAHMHLIVNHVPLFSMALGSLALLWAMVKRSSDIRAAAVILFVVGGVFSWISLETGERAEEMIEHLPSISKSVIHEHEEAAEAAHVAGLLLSVAAIAMGALARYKKPFLKKAEVLVLVLGLIASAMMAKAAFEGGKIIHTEIHQVPSP